MAAENKKSGRFTVFGYRSDSAGQGPVLYGFLFLIPLLLVAGTWSAMAPLGAAAIADGQVVLNFDRKVVQHLEGGIVDKILIEEGQDIARGDPILVIRDIDQRTQINMLYEQLAGKRALYARLTAERDDQLKPDFAALRTGLEFDDVRFDTLIALQERMFRIHKSSLQSKVDIIRSKQTQTRNEITGLEAQLAATQKRITLLADEHEGVADLTAKGYSSKTRMMEIEKDMAELEGEAGAHLAGIARLQQNILGADLEVIDLQNESRGEVLDELQVLEPELQELTHKLVSMRDELKRTIVTAPASGRIMDLQIKTEGAVLNPGARILDIVPLDDRMIIEARINPNDIDLVHEGSKAKVMLSAYKVKKVPKIDGVLVNLSGDIHTDEATGDRYFIGRVAVDEEMLTHLKADVTLYPGMPAQVFFIEGGRTLADYLLTPFLDAGYRAFREE